MTAALEGGEWSAARHGRTLPPGKTRYPFYRRLSGPQGGSRWAENFVPTGIRSRTVQPVVSRYTDLYIYICGVWLQELTKTRGNLNQYLWKYNHNLLWTRNRQRNYSRIGSYCPCKFPRDEPSCTNAYTLKTSVTSLSGPVEDIFEFPAKQDLTPICV